MKYRLTVTLFWGLIGCLVQAAPVDFQGAHSLIFSDQGNWNTYPVKNDSIVVSAPQMSLENPALIDAGFTVPLGLARIYPRGAPGTAYVAIESGGMLSALAVIVGNSANGSFDGHLTLRAGGSLRPTYANSGELSIGGDAPGETGDVIVESAAGLFSHAQLALHPYGTLTLRLGTNSAPTFMATRKIKKGVNTLDGLLRVDLAALIRSGTYTLIDSASPNVPIGGALRAQLDAEGGSLRSSGNFSSDHFVLLNAEGWDWRLSLSDGNQDLVLTVSRPGGQTVGSAKPPPSNGWDMTPWRSRRFDYEELSSREAPFVTADGGDWMRIGDSWVGGKKSTRHPEPEIAAPLAGTLKITDFYITAGGNENGPNRIFCASAVPKERKGPFPVLFVFHGGGGHASGALALAIARKNPGCAAVAVDYNGQFRPSASPVTHWVTQTESLRERHLDLDPDPLNFPMFHNVQAARRVLDWTQEQPWADPEKLGAVGISYGGWVSLILAGVDDRIKCVVTHVSAGGTEGLHSRAGQPQYWEPSDQRSIWLAHADPIAYAAQTRAPVFLELAANDRFFWLSGAARHRDAFGGEAAWLLTPNCDHHNGGPELPDPIGLWTQAVFSNGTPFPTFGKTAFSDEGNSASTCIKSERPIQSVHLVWSAGNAVPPARYWRWIEATERDGVWSAALPGGHGSFAGTAYFTVIDVDGRAVSSSLIDKPGEEADLIWMGGSLWDTAAGAAAWRPAQALAPGNLFFTDAESGRVLMRPENPGKPAAAISNSLNLKNPGTHSGLTLEIGGNGAVCRARMILARNYAATDAQLFAAEIQIPAEFSAVELPWSVFKPYRNTTDGNPLPANGLMIQCDAFPEMGISVGPAHWFK